MYFLKVVSIGPSDKKNHGLSPNSKKSVFVKRSNVYRQQNYETIKTRLCIRDDDRATMEVLIIPIWYPMNADKSVREWRNWDCEAADDEDGAAEE